MKEAYEAGLLIKNMVDKQAMLGIIGIKKVLLNTYNKITKSSLKAFNTKEEACEWLTK